MGNLEERKYGNRPVDKDGHDVLRQQPEGAEEIILVGDFLQNHKPSQVNERFWYLLHLIPPPPGGNMCSSTKVQRFHLPDHFF